MRRPAGAPLQSPQHPSSVPPLLTKHFAWQPQELRSGVGLLGPEPQHHRLYGLGQTALCPHASVSPHAKCGGNNGPYARGTGQSTPMPLKPSVLPLTRARPTAPQWPPGPTRWPSVQACSAPATRASWLLLSLSKPCPAASGPAPWLFPLPEAHPLRSKSSVGGTAGATEHPVVPLPSNGSFDLECAPPPAPS